MGDIRHTLKGGEVRLQAAEQSWEFLKKICGTASYWTAAKSNMLAIRALGPPTWFLTLSADDLGWDDLALERDLGI